MKNRAHDFYLTCNSFCLWAESYEDEADPNLVAIELLSSLYNEVIKLPDTTPAIANDKFDPKVLSERIYNRFSILTPKHYFKQMEQDKIIKGDLHDDLRDIYMDLKFGLLHFESGEFDEAVWLWKYSFKSHWGLHLTYALKVLHREHMVTSGHK